MTNKGFTHWVIVGLISVIAIGLVGVTLYYEKNKNANTTTKANTNSTNAASNANVNSLANSINSANTNSTPTVYTNSTFQLTLTLPTGATVNEEPLGFSDKLNRQIIDFRLPEDATYGGQTIFLSMNPGDVVGKTLEQFAQNEMAKTNLNLSPISVTFNGISGIQYSQISNTTYYLGTYFKDSSGNFAYLYTEGSAPGDINTGQPTTLFSESFKTKVQQEFNTLRDSIKYTN